MRKPFFRKKLKCWYVKNEAGKFIRLDPDEETAYRMWEQMREVQRVGTTDKIRFASLAEAWYLENQVETERFSITARYVARFAEYVGDTLALDVTKQQMMSWLTQAKPGRLRKDNTRSPRKPWGKTTRKDAARSVNSVYAWALGRGKISRNPLYGLKVPCGDPRAVIVSPAQHAACIEECQAFVVPRKSKKGGPPKQSNTPKKRRRKNPAFALYLIASRCGARPRQIREVTAANVLPDFSAWVFADHKSKEKTQKPLIVYLPPCLQTLTRILVEARPTGPLFLNSKGRPWKKDTVGQAMDRLVERAKLPDNITVYAYRHSFATDALLAGQPIAVVAQLMGHSDARMVAKVYGHLDQHRQHLIDAVVHMSKKRLG